MMQHNKQYDKHVRGLKRFLPKTLFGRSLLILITPVFLIQVITTYIFFDKHWSRMTSRLAFALTGEIVVLVDAIEEAEKEKNIPHQFIETLEHSLDLLITYEEGGNIESLLLAPNTATGWASMIKETLSREMSSRLDYPFYISVDFKEKWIDIRIQMPGGVLNIMSPQRRLFSSSSYLFLMWVLGASIVLLIISVLFMRNQVRPMSRLARAAESFGKGHDVAHFKVEGAREIRQAGAAFLDMKIRIQRQITQRTEMLAGVSHDLRTPLTRLKLQIAMLEACEDTQHMQADIQHMEKMIEGYLGFARGEGKEETTLCTINDMLNNVVSDTKQKGLDVYLAMNGVSDTLPCRRLAMMRCFDNIASNAAKYAQSLWITVEKTEPNMLLLVFEDDGEGVDEQYFDDVFRPFYRVDPSRNPETGGVGLGLSIVMDVVHGHGGEVWLGRSEKHGGLALYMQLPI